MEKKSFIIHADWLSMFAALPDADAGAIIKAMIRFTCSGDAGDVSPVHAGILAMMIDGYNQDTAKYMETCERNRQNIRKRWDNTTEYDRIRPNTTEYETIPLDTDKDMEKDMEEDKDTEKEKEKDTKKKGAKAPEKDAGTLAEILQAWNDHENRGAIPCIRDITGKRRSAVLARCKEHGTAEVFRVVDLVFASSFLRGDNRKRWAASFDWTFAPGNFSKIAEGNYNDRQPQTSNDRQKDIITKWIGGAV